MKLAAHCGHSSISHLLARQPTGKRDPHRIFVETRPSVSVPLSVPFVAVNAIKGVASNRDRSSAQHQCDILGRQLLVIVMGRIGVSTMQMLNFPVIRPLRPAWNKRRIVVRKRSLKPIHVWVIRVWLELAEKHRELALYKKCTSRFQNTGWLIGHYRSS